MPKRALAAGADCENRGLKRISVSEAQNQDRPEKSIPEGSESRSARNGIHFLSSVKRGSLTGDFLGGPVFCGQNITKSGLEPAHFWREPNLDGNRGGNALKRAFLEAVKQISP